MSCGKRYVRCPLDVADQLHGVVLLFCGRKGIDVVENVLRACDTKGRAHFGEHVILGLAVDRHEGSAF